MAIAFDNANSAAAASAITATTSAWAIAGSERLLAAGMMWGGATPGTYTAIKWGGSGGTALTQEGATLSAGSFLKLALARLIAPTAASQTLYGEVSGSADEIAVGGISYTGANQTTPFGTPATATGAGASPRAATVNVTSAVGELVTGFSAASSTINPGTMTVVVDASQTMRWEQESINYGGATQSEEVGATSVTLTDTYTFPGSDAAWGIIGVSIKAAAAAAGGGGLMTMGVG